jgi:hypothetical protein
LFTEIYWSAVEAILKYHTRVFNNCDFEEISNKCFVSYVSFFTSTAGKITNEITYQTDILEIQKTEVLI